MVTLRGRSSCQCKHFTEWLALEVSIKPCNNHVSTGICYAAPKG
jgi:hypothetical protein